MSRDLHLVRVIRVDHVVGQAHVERVHVILATYLLRPILVHLWVGQKGQVLHATEVAAIEITNILLCPKGC